MATRKTTTKATATKAPTATTKAPTLASAATKATAPTAPATVPVAGYALTGMQPQAIPARKGKPFRANSQRAVAWAFIQAQLQGGPLPAATLYAQMLASAPVPRAKGKIAGKQSAPSGWYGRFTSFGLLKAVTVQVPAPAVAAVPTATATSLPTPAQTAKGS